MNDKKPIIFLICGKARQGKTTFSNFMEFFYKENGYKVVNTSFAKYLKYYAKEINNYDIDETDKKRSYLQELGNFIRSNLHKEYFLINRLIEDIEIYSYYVDVIIINDVRFQKEIETIKENYDNVVTINLVRPDFSTDLSLEEQNDISEINLDNYNNYDYKIINRNLDELKILAKRIGLEVIDRWKK